MTSRPLRPRPRPRPLSAARPVPAQLLPPLHEPPEAPLLPEQIPAADELLLELSDNQAAEALGLDEQVLQEDVREEERQRHPDVHNDDDNSANVESLADEFHRRLGDA